ncbi:hypothetical protein BDV98DRAFT_596132 [Pterulicium gracile]|uniref:Uncharacterized protein n=1 Tax=Pterulicium gracile TaxID=1884261 RepID=A0A5C3QD82_9AGAR|nr:hypothetical protein BDV98DRAFT_596132 [Pterula gracilis]
MSYSSPSSPDTMKMATKAAADIFSTFGVDAILVGGYALKLHRNLRAPKDVDLALMTTLQQHSPKQLKNVLCGKDSRFQTVASMDPTAHYRVLWFYPRPNKLHFSYIQCLKTASLDIVFLLKLQAWEHHGLSEKEHLRAKVSQHSSDLQSMLPLVNAQYSHEKRVKEYVRAYPDTIESWRALGFNTV